MGLLAGCVQFRIFFFFFSLQSGVILTIAVLAGLYFEMVTMSLYTMTILNAWSRVNYGGLIFSFTHAFFTTLALCYAFLGAYKEEPDRMIRASIFLIFGLLIYVVASIMSFIPSVFEYACVVHRCPDHVWMENSFWRASWFAHRTHIDLRDPGYIRDKGDYEDEYDLSEEEYDSQDTVWKCDWEKLETGGGSKNVSFIQHIPLNDNSTKNGTSRRLKLSPNRFAIHFPVLSLIVSIIFNFLFLAFLIYTTMLFINFSRELSEDDFTTDWERYHQSRLEQESKMPTRRTV